MDRPVGRKARDAGGVKGRHTMAQTSVSKIKGLHKHHSRGSTEAGRCKLDEFRDRVRGTWAVCLKAMQVKGHCRVVAGQRRLRSRSATADSAEPLPPVLNFRLKDAIEHPHEDSADGEQQSLGSGQRFREFVLEWRTHYAERRGSLSEFSSRSIRVHARVRISPAASTSRSSRRSTRRRISGICITEDVGHAVIQCGATGPRGNRSC